MHSFPLAVVVLRENEEGDGAIIRGKGSIVKNENSPASSPVDEDRARRMKAPGTLDPRYKVPYDPAVNQTLSDDGRKSLIRHLKNRGRILELVKKRSVSQMVRYSRVPSGDR
jgi:hypothetical protein